MALVNGFPGHSGQGTFADLRRDLEGSVVRSAAGVMRAGLFPGSATQLVTGRADMKVDVADFRAVQNRGGAIFLANDGVAQVALDAAPASNKRIDLIYVFQQSTTLGDAADVPVFGVVKGTASPNPSVPALPSAVSTAIPLATVEIPAGATTTSSAGVIITQVFPWTAMAGGTLHVRNSVELDAWVPAVGAKAHNLGSGVTFVRTSGGWVPDGNGWAHQVSGTDSGNFVAPSAPTQLMFKSGYVRVQLSSAGVTTVTFSTPFPTRGLHVSATAIEGTGIAPVVNARAIDASSFQLVFPGAGAAIVAFTWLAVGY